MYRRNRKPSTSFDQFFFGKFRWKTLDNVAQVKKKIEKKIEKNHLTTGDFHAKTPPYPPRESPSNLRANPKLAWDLLPVIVLPYGLSVII